MMGVVLSGQGRTAGGQSGLVPHGFPPFLPGRTRTHAFRRVRLSGKHATRTIGRSTMLHAAPVEEISMGHSSGSLSGRPAWGGVEPQYFNLCSESRMPSRISDRGAKKPVPASWPTNATESLSTGVRSAFQGGMSR